MSTDLRSRNFFSISAADLIARTAYQMGKTPLLPIFAASLGASDALLGIIVSVSTFTGMALKPAIGVLSDRWGRRLWLLTGTVFFAGMPFLYRFVTTPEQLFAIRVVHGLATAIYGPVTLAYVAEETGARRAEGMGWFGIARSTGYIIGPALAGWLLLVMDPVGVYTIIGLMSCAVFVPILLISERPARGVQNVSVGRHFAQALASGSRTPGLWLAGTLEAVVYIALYAMKAFLPIYALSMGVNVAVVGTFFALQELVVAAVKPFGGRLGDRVGYLQATALGMMVVGVALPLLTRASGTLELFLAAIVLGAGQALIFPSTTALIAVQVDDRHVGAGMGLLGTLQNGGKVLGPILGGLMAAALGYESMFVLMGMLLAAAAMALALKIRMGRQPPMAWPGTSGD